MLSFKDPTWSLNGAQWLDDTRVQLFLRKYPGDHQPSSFEVVVDCQQEQAWLMGAPPIALNALEAALEALYERSRIKA